MFILPINRDSDSIRTPWIVVLLMAVNTAVLLLIYATQSSKTVALQYGFIPASPHWRTLISSLFVHAGILHLLGNMWFLWMFGHKVEEALGSWLFAAAYLLCGLGGNALHYTLNLHSPIPCIGASGAISGVAGMYFILFPRSDFDLDIYLGWWRIKTIATYARVAIGTWFAEQAVLALLTQALHTLWIAFWAHVGGFITGVVLALFSSFLTSDDDRIWLSAKDLRSDD